MSPFPTSSERIVIDILMEWLGESSLNRTPQEYITIAQKVPKPAAVHAYVNQRLAEIAATNSAPYRICHFKCGDRYVWFAEFPKSVSLETVRTAINKFGVPQLRALASSNVG
jgi:hypothetical protein